MKLDTPGIEEYDAILDLWDRCEIPARPEGRDAKERLSAELRDRPEYWIAAYDDDELVGIVVGTDDGRKGWVNRLAVHPAYRRRGVASRLLAALETAFEQNDVHVFAALIEDENVDSRSFFEARGYEDSDVHYYSKRENDRV